MIKLDGASVTTPENIYHFTTLNEALRAFGDLSAKHFGAPVSMSQSNGVITITRENGATTFYSFDNAETV